MAKKRNGCGVIGVGVGSVDSEVVLERGNSVI